MNVAHLLPENLSEIEGSFYEPLGCCVRAVHRADLKANSTVLVVGLGSIGILMAQALKAHGMNVIGCDLIDERVDLLKSFGIKAVNSSNFDDTKNISLKFSGRRCATFIKCSSDKYTNSLNPPGIIFVVKIIVFSSTPKNFGYANYEIYYRELTVLGSYSPAPSDLRESLELLKSGKVKVKNLSTVYEFDKINEAFKDTIANKILKAYIKIS